MGGPNIRGNDFDANADVNLGTLPVSDVKLLDEVTIAKPKQFIERHDGKMILDTENSIALGPLMALL